MVDSAQRGATSRESDLEAAIEARLARLDSGKYRANNRVVLSYFADFCLEERGVTSLDDLEVIDCRRYAQHIHDRAQDDSDDLSAASAYEKGPYFTIVRSFLSWCVEDERIDDNPARVNRVTNQLPDFDEDSEQQYWSAGERKAILSHVNRRVDRALDHQSEDGSDYPDAPEAGVAFRDRALVSMLAMTGVRGAEILSEPKDEERNGLRWSDIDFERGVAQVFGKTRVYQPVSLVDDVLDHLERHKRVQEPGSDEWPVFVTGHLPTLYGDAREQLADRGFDEDAREELLADVTGTGEVLSLYREHDLVPAALSTNGGRTIMRRLCKEADLEIDGEYLKPHGGRRGLGDDLYTANPVLAQETLRHQSIETTHESYREEKAAQRREDIQEALEDG